jgi:hypothetical protein
METSFSIFGKSDIVEKSSSVFSVDGVKNAPTFHFSTWGLNNENKSAKTKIFYGCNNTEKKILKPAFCIMGYNPANLETFNSLVKKYNTNGYLDELHARDYDVIVVRFDNGVDRIENEALILKHILKTINTAKYNNGSFQENIITGYSSGSLVARMALKMMEKEYFNNPILTNAHHTKLYVSYDGEIQGANIPLAAQHSVRSILDNPQWYLPFDNLLNSLEMDNLISSPMAKDFMYYHYSQTGNSNSPGQAPYPFFIESRNKYVTDYYVQYSSSGFINKPGEYPLIRNIGVANGADGPNERHNPLGNLAQNSILLKIDKHFGVLGWDRHNFMEWRAVDGQGHKVFKRIFEKKGLFSPDYEVLLDEEKATNYNVLNLDGIMGSTMGIYGIIKGFTKFSYLTFNPDIEVDSKDCFVPTKSALDISPNVMAGSQEVDIRSRNLLWWIDNPLPGEEQRYQYGYPSIYHGVSQYTQTPFDGIFVAKNNVQHGAKSEIKAEMEGLTDFLISETQYDDVWLQNQEIGGFMGGAQTYGFYKVKYQATNSITTGSHATYKTQYKPIVIHQNTVVECKAGESITFGPDTHIKPGATVHAYIENSAACSRNFAMNEPEQQNEAETLEKQDSRIENTSVEKSSNWFHVYPNPNEGNFMIQLPNSESTSITVFDITGKKVGDDLKQSDSNLIKMELPKGVYFIVISQKGYVETHKISVL